MSGMRTGATVLTVEYRGGMNVHAYGTWLDAVEGLLTSHGREGFDEFVANVLPKVQRAWDEDDKAEADFK